ncbi:uncharacterized protein ARMOST_00001 [Armillaria ostoyae]|uniref:HAT C-terminal dimerisation domain-containing protein n=1 Tax=Armillaria ostoyae TaxID=47428 RepID=A0A284QJX5_ARMOS|nr:uncharacterized protein ARMOST_00001 [Armillaria ostoyae]
MTLAYDTLAPSTPSAHPVPSPSHITELPTSHDRYLLLPTTRLRPLFHLFQVPLCLFTYSHYASHRSLGQEVEPDVGFGWGWQQQDRRSSRGCRLDVVCHAYVRGFDAQTGVVVAMAIGRRYQDLHPACLLVPFCPTTHPDVLVTAIQPSLSYIMFLCRSRSPFPLSALSLLLSLLPVVELGSVGLGLLSCEMAADIESLSGFYSLGVPELLLVLASVQNACPIQAQISEVEAPQRATSHSHSDLRKYDDTGDNTTQTRPSKRTRHGDDASSNVDNPIEISDRETPDEVDEDAEGELVHENTEEAKQAWEKKLARMRRRWNASVYDHFLSQVNVAWNAKNRRWQQVFLCKRDPTIKVHRAFHDNGTANMNRHVRSCTTTDCDNDDDEVKLVQSSLVPFIQGSTYTYGRLRAKQVMLCRRHHMPFAFTEYEEYQGILRMFNKDVRIPSVDTLSRDVKDVYTLVKKRVAELFQKSHTGVYLAGVICDTLRGYGVIDKLLSLPGDNASNNVVMARSLKGPGKLPSTHIAGPTTRVLCAGHIFDLANKAIFRYFVKKAKATDRGFLDDDDDSWLEDDEEDEMDEDEQELLDDVSSEREADEEAMLDELLMALDELDELEAADRNLGRNAVMKIFKLGRRMFHNGAMQADLAAQCEHFDIEVEKMIRAVVTRWLTHRTILQRALDLRPALDAFCDLDQWNEIPKKAIRKYKLNDEEWLFLVQLKPILLMLASATLQMSQSGVPLIHQVIPMFDEMISQLEDIIMDHKLFPGVRAAAIRARAVLCKYYSKTDDSYMYRMALMMHPAYKIEYFHEQNWEPEWVDRCFEIVREVWNKHYKPTISVINSDNQASAKSSSKDLPDLLKKRRRNHTDTDVLEKYLRDPIIEDLDDPLHYWTSLLDPCDRAGKVSSITPKGALAQMALDFLSAPGTLQFSESSQ